MLRIVAIGVLLVYYWYFCRFSIKIQLQPSSPSVPSLLRSPYVLDSDGIMFYFGVNGEIKWIETLPNGYYVHDGRIHLQDVCYQEPDGAKVLATGKTLYNYLKLDKLDSSSTISFESNASFPLQQGHVFYFTCHQNAISDVNMCPPGHVFQQGTCQAIDVCTGKQTGVILPDPYDILSYYECLTTGAQHRTCPKNHYFLHNTCYSTNNLVEYCSFNKDPLILNDITLLRCFDKNPVIETCPTGMRLFGTLLCQSTECVGKPNNARIALPLKVVDPFQFSPGYRVCQNERVSDPYICPSTWDHHLSLGDNLTHLPQVFDGQKCTVPSLCMNVEPNNANIIVPVHEFTKHVRNWKLSEAFDQVTGYRCEGDSRKRVALPAGQHISKKFKIDSACVGGSTLNVPVSGKPEHYFDCSTLTVQTCPNHEFFNGTQCQKRMPYAFQYNDIDLFKFNGLSHDGWISNWDYFSTPKDVKHCTAPESSFLAIYDVCSHPECTLYPFLAQVNFPIKLPDQTECIYRFDRITKRAIDYTYNYWSQRERVKEEDRMCTPGQKVGSGHFVIDSSLYATCDVSQPFVFCPSPLTTGIQKIHDQRFACVLSDPLKGQLSASVPIKFQKGELDRVVPLLNTAPPLISINQRAFAPIPATGMNIPDSDSIIIESNQRVGLEYNRKITYPPEMAFTKHGMTRSPSEYAYLIKHNRGTMKPVTFSKHDTVACVEDFD